MNARRRLKTLETLARARDMELTDLKRAAAAAAERLAKMEANIKELETAVVQEAHSASGDSTMISDWVRYAANMRGRLTILAGVRESMRADVDQADAMVLDAYRALKQIEEAADTRRREIDDEDARKERAVADDLAAIRATRQRA